MLYIVINSVCLSFHYEAGFSGDIMWCDGSCMRAFHCGVEKAAQEDSMTDSDDSADEAEVSHSQPQLHPFQEHCLQVHQASLQGFLAMCKSISACVYMAPALCIS